MNPIAKVENMALKSLIDPGLLWKQAHEASGSIDRVRLGRAAAEAKYALSDYAECDSREAADNHRPTGNFRLLDSDGKQVGLSQFEREFCETHPECIVYRNGAETDIDELMHDTLTGWSAEDYSALSPDGDSISLRLIRTNHPGYWRFYLKRGGFVAAKWIVRHR
jgi:hypothetical protein